MSDQPTETEADVASSLIGQQAKDVEGEPTPAASAKAPRKAPVKRVTKTPRKAPAKTTTSKSEATGSDDVVDEKLPEVSTAQKSETEPKSSVASAAKRKPRTSMTTRAAGAAKTAAKKTAENRKVRSTSATSKSQESTATRPATAQTRRASSISSRAATMRKYDLAIRVTGLAKSFDDTAAVDTINFDVPRGKIYGIVGPNGAGKTTTLLMLAGLLRPDQGRITVNDYDVWTDPDEAKALMGIMLDRFVLFDRLTGWQMLYYTGVLRGMKHKDVKKRSEELVQLFRLENSASRLVQDYSAGMVKKLSLACAMMHSPEVLILDEPFESVDPVSTQALIRVLKEQAEQGTTVILSSHDMNLVSRTCDFLAVIIDGRVLDQGEIGDVLQGKTLEERFSDLAGSAAMGETK